MTTTSWKIIGAPGYRRIVEDLAPGTAWVDWTVGVSLGEGEPVLCSARLSAFSSTEDAINRARVSSMVKARAHNPGLFIFAMPTDYIREKNGGRLPDEGETELIYGMWHEWLWDQQTWFGRADTQPEPKAPPVLAHHFASVLQHTDECGIVRTGIVYETPNADDAMAAVRAMCGGATRPQQE